MITTVQIKTLPSDYQQDFIMTDSEAKNFVDGFRSKKCSKMPRLEPGTSQ